MKKFVLFSILAFVSTSGLYANAVFESDPYGDGFTFPEYSDTLFIESSLGGCSASCVAMGGGTNSCSGSGDCICSCSSFQCECVANPDTSTGYSQPEIDISINKTQYQNLKELAYILYETNDDDANQAYLHLGGIVESLKDKDAVNYHKQRDLYFASLYRISSNEVKAELNIFFEKIGLTDRV